MRVVARRWRTHALTIALGLLAAGSATATEPALSKEQIRQFLLTAKVVGSKQSKKGITQPWRLTLSDGVMTHDAGFQAIDQYKATMQFAAGGTEINFVDSYKYNLAAYALAEMLGLEDMLPVYVEREWNGQTGSLSWWLPVKMDEGERLKRKASPPDTDAWNQQMHRIRVLDELVYDTDANLTNVLIGEDWTIWRIDFSRAFRVYKDLKSSKDLVRCDRRLFMALGSLNEDELTRATGRYLSKSEIRALMARREKIVAHFQKLIAEKGESEVLY